MDSESERTGGRKDATPSSACLYSRVRGAADLASVPADEGTGVLSSSSVGIAIAQYRS